LEIKSVGVIGAGQMGSGIAQVFATAGYTVHLFDQSPDASLSAMAEIDHNMDRMIAKGTLARDQKSDSLARLNIANTLADLGPLDLIIEAATEDEPTKQSILTALTPHLAPHTIVTSNTSSISITRLAACTDRPEKFMGLHFMKPVPLMELVELIRGIATTDETFETIQTVVASIGKTANTSQDYPAFIVNRILMPMINEAIYTLYEGVGTVEGIDASLELGLNHALGPLKMADYVGLDTVLAIMNVLHNDLADRKYRPCPLLTKYVEAGWLGRKSGRGFYDYSQTPPKPTR
jgi:3-hydroxybutyryl-CoA dehydrogenase